MIGVFLLRFLYYNPMTAAYFNASCGISTEILHDLSHYASLIEPIKLLGFFMLF